MSEYIEIQPGIWQVKPSGEKKVVGTAGKNWVKYAKEGRNNG